MAGRAFSCWIAIVMIALAEAVYLPPALFDSSRTLLGLDYRDLHVQRITFARQAVLSGHGLPTWYPYDFLGAPFTANLQSFPWIPTRLLLLLLAPEVAYAAGVALAAALAAGFTFLFCRRAGLSPLGAAAAGWTFACAGFFSSRVAAGHLPLLEAYAALPLLLWAADRALASRRCRDLLLLALSGACFAVAGHPQVPAYALTASALYVLWRGRGAARARVVSVLASGIGTTLIVWWPMLLLIQRSSRILPLAPADNDIALPYGRLLALLVPGIDGWPDPLLAAGTKLFGGYPNDAYFWDTASYLGLLPLAAVLFLALGCLIVPRRPARPWMFLAALGLGALVCSLALTQPALALLPGTLLRSFALCSDGASWAPASRSTPSTSAASPDVLFLPCRVRRPTPPSCTASSPENSATRGSLSIRATSCLSPAATKTWVVSIPFSSRATIAPCSPSWMLLPP